jgi:hypothetical protein
LGRAGKKEESDGRRKLMGSGKLNGKVVKVIWKSGFHIGMRSAQKALASKKRLNIKDWFTNAIRLNPHSSIKEC